MRIALFTDTYPPEINGVATSCKSLRDILVKNGHDVLVVTTNPFNDEMLFEDNILRLPGKELKWLYGYRLANILSTKGFKEIRRFNPNIIHIQTDFSIGIIGRNIAKKLNCPTIYTYHTMYEDYTYYVTKGHFDRIGKQIMRSYSKNTIMHYDGFITPSNKTKDYMRRIGVDIYANVIPTGVDFSKFLPDNLDKKKVDDLHKKFGIAKDEFILLSLGRIAQEKSIDFSITCFSRFLKDHPDIKVRMVIVGGGPAKAELEQLTKDLKIEDKVLFTGPCSPSEVQYYYSLGKAFVSASLSETQGLTYMEAMASHLYVLARYDHNLLDVIEEGNTGYFFESPEEFSKKLFKVYELYKANDKAMLDHALKSIEHYSIDTFYESVIKAYKQTIKRRW